MVNSCILGASLSSLTIQSHLTLTFGGIKSHSTLIGGELCSIWIIPSSFQVVCTAVSVVSHTVHILIVININIPKTYHCMIRDLGTHEGDTNICIGQQSVHMVLTASTLSRPLEWSATLCFQWLLSWLLHKWREGYLVPTWARKITCDISTECSFRPDDDWGIQSKRQQVIFRAQVGTR